MKVVLDASVVLKWLLTASKNEPDTPRATALMQAVVEGRLEILQPFHWLAEVAAVLARISPETAVDDTLMLHAMDLPTTDEPQILKRACQISIETTQHMFDALYHAVALETDDAVLVTADDRYRAKVQARGRIVAMREWQLEAG